MARHQVPKKDTTCSLTKLNVKAGGLQYRFSSLLKPDSRIAGDLLEYALLCG